MNNNCINIGAIGGATCRGAIWGDDYGVGLVPHKKNIATAPGLQGGDIASAIRTNVSKSHFYFLSRLGIMAGFYPFRGFRKMFTKKKLFARKRRVAKKTKMVVKPFVVKKSILDDVITVPYGPLIFGTDTFELNDLPQAPSYLAVYDQYRILKVTYRFRALSTVSVTGPINLYNTAGMIHTLIDVNDSVTPTTIQQMMNDSTYRSCKSTRDMVRTFKPKFLNDIGGSSPAQSKSGWISTAFPNVSHYGIKWAFQPGVGPVGNPNYSLEPIITIWVEFKDQK